MKYIYTYILLFCAFGIFAQNTNQFTYDAQSRLTQTTYSNGVSYEYTYDKLGNRVGKTIVGKSLKVSATQLAIAAAANSTANFTISSNQNWSISSSQSWLSPNVSNGSNNQTITLTATQNSETNSREATITVSANGINPLTIVVTQAGTENILDVTPTNLSLASSSGSNATFSISCNIYWHISVTESWLTLSSTTGNGNQNISVTANSDNTSSTPRTATITVFSEGLEDKYVTVTQAGTSTGSYLTLTTSEITIAGASGSTDSFSISSNVNWTLSTTGWWVGLSSTSGSNNATITCTALAENTENEERRATIYVFIDGEYADEVVLFQSPSNPRTTMTYVPDDNFEQALIDLGYDSGELNDSVPTANIDTVTYLILTSEQITDLTGIEDFISLDTLGCSYNNLTALDLSNNTELKYLGCRSNELTSLNISNNTKLAYLDCDDNSLANLNLNGLTALWKLKCSRNLLTNLNLSSNTSLVEFYCTDNQLTSLDLYENVNLAKLNCRDNQIESLDLSNTQNLIYLGCYNNQLTNLNIKNGNNSILEDMNCTNNPDLNCIEVDDPVSAMSNANWEKDAIPIYSMDCNNATLPTMTYIPDDNFEQWLIDRHYDSGELNDSVPTANINTITSLLLNSSNISDLTGISGFTALEILNCTSNQLSDLDLSRNKSLKKLYCVDNQLSSLNVSANDSLIELWCYFNPLTSLDVSNNIALQKLYCENTQITELDIRNNSQLTTIDCQDNNQLASLNLKNGNNTNFVMIRANDNPNLTCVTVDDPAYSETNWESNFDEGVEFSTNCNGDDIVYIPDANFKAALVGNSAINTNGDNEIQVNEAEAYTGHINVAGNWNTPDSEKILDLTGIEAFTSITRLNCEYNLLTSLDLRSNTFLTYLDCGINNLTSIDVGSCILLTELYCHSNEISILNIDNNTALVKLDCGSNLLTNLDMSNNTALKELWCYANSLSALNVGSNLALTHFNCRQNQLTALDVSLNTAMVYLNFGENQLSAIDIGNNISLKEFGCWSNQLTNLNISNNLQIEKLKCDNNQLTSLNVSPHTNLVLLECFDNQLTELDVSNNHNLKALHCYDNSLSILNLANGNNDNMQQQYFRVWRIVSSGRTGSFNASNNPNLTCIQVDDPEKAATYTDWQKDETASYSNDCGNTIVQLTNIYPYNGETNVPISPILKWSCSGSVDCENIPPQVCVSNNSTFNGYTLYGGIPNGQYERQIPDLDFSTTYYWKVSLFNGEWSEVWSFTTENQFGIFDIEVLSNLIISTGIDSCFGATNSIFVANPEPVTVQINASATFIAGQSIRFLPGFHAQNGSYVSAHITTDGSFCDMLPQSIVQNTPEPDVFEKSVTLENKGEQVLEQMLKAYPNPTSGLVTIEMKNFNNQKQVEIINITGQTVFKQQCKDDIINIDISSYSKGLYIVKCNDGNDIKSQRIVMK